MAALAGAFVVLSSSAPAAAQSCPYTSINQCPAGYNRIAGTGRDDVIVGTSGNDCILGGKGDDTIDGGGGDDIICGGDGDDTITGGDGNDTIYGDGGDDDLSGGNGNDYLDGGGGTNDLDGGSGTDVCVGGGTACESLTPVTLTELEARLVGGRPLITWSTADEAGTLGFELRRRGQDGIFRPVREGLVPAAHDSPLGGTYYQRDPEPARPGERLTYEIVAHSAGVAQTHGPFELTVMPGEGVGTQGEGPRAFAQQSRRMARSARLQPREPAERARRALRGLREEGRALKIGVSSSGLHRISAAALAAHLEVSEERVEQWLASHRFSLSSAGQPVAWWSSPREPGLVFYGQESSSIYASERVYFLTVASGPTMRRVAAQSPPARDVPDAAAFSASAIAEEDRFAGLVVDPDPESDYWFWAVLVSGMEGRDSFAAPLALEGLRASGEATLRVRVHGAAVGAHRLDLHVNGVRVGEVESSGLSDATLEQAFDAALLREGGNQVEVRLAPRSLGGPSIVYLDRVELRYPRRYHVSGGQLTFEARGPTALEVTDADALVFDVSVPATPALVVGLVSRPQAGGWRLLLGAPQEGGRYVAVQRGGWLSPAWIRPDAPSAWRAASNAAEYLVIAPAEHLDAAAYLAELRAATGLSAAVVDVEDLYDEFGDGTASPHAIRAFLSHAVREWSVPPRYVVLAGAASYDYRDVLGWGESLVPTFMVRTGNGLYASDTRLADVVGDDGVPDLAIGRLPARSAAELEQLVDKLARYERASATTPAGTLSLVADGRDGVIDYGATGDALLAEASVWASERIYRDLLGAAATRARAQQAFGSAALLGYLGHGSVAQLGKRDVLLATSHVAALPASETPPAVLAMTCTMGRFELPGYTGLAEALVGRPDGGAIAVLSASALSEHVEASRFLGALLAGASEEAGARLGDVVLAAQSWLVGAGQGATVLRTYNLLGDPALTLRR